MTTSEIAEQQDKELIKSPRTWFINLKKWQKGCTIGCAVGIVFASLTVLGVQQYQMGSLPWDWILRFHSSPAAVFDTILPLRPYILADLATAVSIIIVYGIFGAVVAKFQQVVSTNRRRLLTGFAVLFLIFVYWFNYQIAILFENIF